MERKPDPPPLRTNDVVVVAIGAALWAVGLVVALVAGASDVAWTCVAGLLLGFVGIAYTRRRAAAIARDETSQNGPDPAGH